MTINTAISEILKAEGFEQMSKDVLNCKDSELLQRYAKVAHKNAPKAMQADIASRFKLLKVM